MGGTMKLAETTLVGVVIALLALVLWFGATIVRLENENYAMRIGMCGEHNPADFESIMTRNRCLEEVETRTSPVWHLFYALTD